MSTDDEQRAVSDCDCGRLEERRGGAQELLGAEEAYRKAPTLQNTSRLSRARRRVEGLLVGEPAER